MEFVLLDLKMPPKKKPIDKLKESVELDLKQRPKKIDADVFDKMYLAAKRQLKVVEERISGKSTLGLQIANALDNRIIVEEPDVETANQLALSGEFCQPRFSEHRNCYILIRRKQ